MSYLWRRFQEGKVVLNSARCVIHSIETHLFSSSSSSSSLDGMDVTAIQNAIESVIVKTLMVADDAIPNQPNSFELYGFDIMLDAH